MRKINFDNGKQPINALTIQSIDRIREIAITIKRGGKKKDLITTVV
jgi:hypothetical protein